MDTEAAKRFAVERVEALFNRKELDRIEDPGYEGFRLRLQRLHKAFPDLHMEVEEVIAEGDLVAYRAILSGTHEGELMGMAPTNRSFSVQHMHFLRLRDGKASEHWATRDDLGMLRQLGVIGLPGRPPR
jgi:predicted ester cyclase